MTPYDPSSSEEEGLHVFTGRWSMSLLSKNGEWIFSGIGVYLLTLLLGIGAFIVRYALSRRARLNRFAGIYEALQFRIRNGGGFIRSSIAIQRRMTSLHVEVIMPRYRYAGECFVKGQILYIVLKGFEHDSDFFLIFRDPLGSFNVLVGVYAAITAERHPLAGKIVLRRTGFSDHKAIIPAYLAANEAPNEITELLSNKTGNLVIVDHPISFLNYP